MKLNPQQEAPQVSWRCEDEGVLELTPMEHGSCMVKVLKATKGGVLVYAECGGAAARLGKRKLPYLLVREFCVQISLSHRAGEQSDGLSLLPR